MITLKSSVVLAARLLFSAGLFLLLVSCRQVPKAVQAEPTPVSSPNAVKIIGTIKHPAVTESSGLVASRSMPGAYWTHNDSGDGPFIYGVGKQGEALGVWRVGNAKADDWEDISIGPGPTAGKSYLYIGDIGDNTSSRNAIVVYRVLEPNPTPADAKSTKSKPQLTQNAEAISLRYPDGKHDAETLLVHPTTGNIYVITKVALQNPVVYEAVAPFDLSKTITMKRLGEIKIPSLFGGILTGGTVSPDGKRVAFCDYLQAYEMSLPSGSKNFDDIWKEQLVSFDFGKRKQGEAIAYRLDGKALIGTSEGKRSQLIQVER